MRIGLLTAIWRRPRITLLVLRHYAELHVRGVEFVRVGVITLGDPEPCDLPEGWWVACADNEPLGRKWNAGMQAMRELEPDAVVITGSDDLLNAQYFRTIVKLLKTGADFIELQGFYFYDVETGACIHHETKRPGAGRCLSSRILDQVDWRPWEDDVDINLEGSMYRVFGFPGVAVRKIHLTPPTPLCERTFVSSSEKGIVCLGFKSLHPDGTSANVWSFDVMRERIAFEDADGRSLLISQFPAVAAGLL